MNFQSVSTAEKLPGSDGLKGGYTAPGVPGPLLAKNLEYIDTQVGRMLSEIQKDGLARTTTVILSAKHGQSPTDPAALTRIDDGPLLDGLDAAWKKAHPSAAQPLVAHSADDDGMLLWLNDRSQAAADFARSYLLAQSGQGNDVNGKPKAFTRGGLQTVYAGAAAAKYFGTSVNDDRVPQVFGIGQYGVVYTGGTSKIAEHGGAHADDLAVPLVVSGAGAAAGRQVDATVHTTSIAPTILKLLGLDPRSLDAVRKEGTPALPGLGR
jgi:arylsulfatase A-like enzyme